MGVRGSHEHEHQGRKTPLDVVKHGRSALPAVELLGAAQRESGVQRPARSDPGTN